MKAKLKKYDDVIFDKLSEYGMNKLRLYSKLYITYSFKKIYNHSKCHKRLVYKCVTSLLNQGLIKK